MSIKFRSSKSFGPYKTYSRSIPTFISSKSEIENLYDPLGINLHIIRLYISMNYANTMNI
ncbi:hypothetical protein EMIT0P294_40174 [Pseudomonas sp. IT-P294]